MVRSPVLLLQEKRGQLTSPSPTKDMSPRTTSPQSVRCSSKHSENKSVTPSEKACLFVCRRPPSPKDRGNPLWKVAKSHDRSEQSVVESGQELNTEHAQFRTLLDRQKQQILAYCQAEIRRRIPCTKIE